MSVLNQKTIKKIKEFTGVGLHSGKNVTMRLYPAHPNTGIIFKVIILFIQVYLTYQALHTALKLLMKMA